jgi:cold shock CspA family protein
MSEKGIGTIVKYIADRKFGFIHPDGADHDLFFHHSHVIGGGLHRNATVEFEVCDGLKPGTRMATNIRIVQ